jgi:hypothetical protein
MNSVVNKRSNEAGPDGEEDIQVQKEGRYKIW